MIALPTNADNVTTQTDSKLATWVIYVPKTTSVWHAITDGYGRKVTIVASSKADAEKRLADFASKNTRKISPTETGTVRNYGLYAFVSGAVLGAIGYFTKSIKVMYAGGGVAAVGAGTAAWGSMAKPVLGAEQMVPLPGTSATVVTKYAVAPKGTTTTKTKTVAEQPGQGREAEGGRPLAETTYDRDTAAPEGYVSTEHGLVDKDSLLGSFLK